MVTPLSEIRQPLSVGQAPVGSICLWCSKPAVHRFMLLRGPEAQVPQVFCRSCGEAYARDVASELYREVPEAMYINA